MTQELKTRLVWGFAAGAGVLITTFLLGPEATFLVALGAGVAGWREYCRLMGLDLRPAFKYVGYILLSTIFAHMFFVGGNTLFWLWLTGLIGFAIVSIEYGIERRKRPAGDVAFFQPELNWTHLCRFVLGIFYLFMLFGFVGPIISKIRGDQILTLAFATVFMGDTGAYFVGKARGKRKLWPELSPGKTIEGALGGWVGSVAASLLLWGLFSLIFKSSITWYQCLTVGFCAGPLSQLGDLLESLMKRVSGRKDSGTLLPGHGGILDRADGLVFVMPLVYFLF
jgi:phosphatidate cytidylyltransferase